MTEKEIDQKKERPEVQTFSVPFALEEIKEDISINSNISTTKLSKEQIIKQAFNFHSQGNLSEAEKYYQLFINQGFKDHRIFSNYGVILRDLGKLKEAELSYRKAIEMKPNYAMAHYNLGNILKKVGKLEEAELSTRKAIEIKPDFALAHSNLGIKLRDLGKLEEAELSIRKAIDLKPDFADAYSNLGIILRDLGKLKEAELSTRKAIEIKPDFAMAHYNLGNIFKELGNLKEAEISYSKAIELKPDLSSALSDRGQLYFETGEFDLALKDSYSYNTEASRGFSLEILYALGKIDEIYKRIEENSEIDSKNIRVAAFSAFISEKKKKDTAHNFCQKPLSFLFFSNLRSHDKDYDQFIKGVIKELDDVPTIWEPRTTHNGFQTPTTLNLFSKSSKNISQLKTIILNEIDSYYLKFKNESCSFIQQWPSVKSIFAWYNVLNKQGYQDAHIHPSGWLSGVIYLKVVPPLNKDEGAIEFSLNGPNYSDVNSPQITYQPKLGDIILFPSSLNHRTIPFTTDTERIVMAFDLMPKDD